MTSEINPWWTLVEGPNLAQGDYLPRCLVPIFDPEYGVDGDPHDVPVCEYDCVVVTQSCDLENKSAPLVAVCPLWKKTQYEQLNPKYKSKERWESVRKGRVEGLHLLASFDEPNDNQTCVVVDFRQIYSLPIAYLEDHAITLGRRSRLTSPYVEHFSQAFARFFMRVGLPSNIPPFK